LVEANETLKKKHSNCSITSCIGRMFKCHGMGRLKVRGLKCRNNG